MSISNSTLSAIQKIGAAAFTVKEKLRKEVKAYADLVNNAVATDAYQTSNNILFEKWKAVARLSQTIERIEDELKNAYQVAFSLTSDDTEEVLTLPAPQGRAGQGDTTSATLAPTDIKIKRSKKVVPVKAAVKKPGKPKKAAKTAARKVSNPRALRANPTKLMAHLEGLLNSDEFTPIHQTEIATATGIPMGSMSAALKKLVEVGRLVAGPASTFKLTAPTLVPAA